MTALKHISGYRTRGFFENVLRRQSNDVKKDIRVMDLFCETGSRTGEMTRLLHSHLPDRSIHMMGIDNKPSHIDVAKTNEYSRQDTNIIFRCGDITHPSGMIPTGCRVAEVDWFFFQHSFYRVEEQNYSFMMESMTARTRFQQDPKSVVIFFRYTPFEFSESRIRRHFRTYCEQPFEILTRSFLNDDWITGVVVYPESEGFSKEMLGGNVFMSGDRMPLSTLYMNVKPIILKRKKNDELLVA